MSDLQMWAVHIHGPDDVYAVPDRQIADAVALVLNWQWQRHPPTVAMRAEVIEWPHGYEAWRAERDLFRLEAAPFVREQGARDE